MIPDKYSRFRPDVNFIKRYMQSTNAASGSEVDANANVENKNIATMAPEIHKKANIYANRLMMHDKLKELYDEATADEYIRQLEAHEIYRNDEAGMPVGTPYCVSVSMYPFLLDGLKRLGGTSEPPRNLDSFCGSFVNLVFAVAAQFAGAVSTPEFISYLCYFVGKEYGYDFIEHPDKVIDLGNRHMTIREMIRAKFQQIIYSINQPAAARGCQCVRADVTQLWTPNGFKYLHELKEGDLCYVWRNGQYAVEPIEHLNVYDYDGELVQIFGRNYQQTVTPNHRVIYRASNNKGWHIKEAQELENRKSALHLPINGKIQKEDYPISDALLTLVTYTLTDAHIKGRDNTPTKRLSFTMSPNRRGRKEVISALCELGISYREDDHPGKYGIIRYINIASQDAKVILEQINYNRGAIPDFFLQLSERQAKLVIKHWAYSDGQTLYGRFDRVKLQCDNMEIADKLQQVVMLAGLGSRIKTAKCHKIDGGGDTSTIYVDTSSRSARTAVTRRVPYKGKVWCPSTKTGIVIFREDNYIPYVTGNSVFWNVAYFDKPYFDGLFDGFIFPDGTELKELWPQVNWLQREFMTWFNKERTKKILTFPVESFSLLNDGEDFVDKDSAAWVAEMYSEGHSFFTYTSDSVDSLSSCCYSGDTHVRVLDEKGKSCVTTFQKIADYPQYYVHKNGTIYVYSCGEYKPAKFVELPHQKVYEVKTKGRYMRVTADHRNWIVQSREPVLTKDLHIGDQLYAYNPHINNFELATIYDIREYKYNGNVFCFQMMDKHDDMFTLANGIHNYNCRLRNNLQENTFSYTLGAGGVATGSKCVITMNMNRLVQNATRNGVDLSEAVAEQTRKIHKYLRAFNEILKDMFNARMLQVYDAGFISLDKQYLTVGVNGLNEGAEFLGIKISDNEAYRNYINTVLKPIYDIDKQDREPGLMWNFELIPAENLGVKNAKWDKQDGYFSPRDCYNSYFYLVEDDTMSPQEKFRLHGKEYTQYCDGGSALHCNLDEHLSYEQYKFLMKYAVKTGCPYFTFNIPNTVCNDCGHISKHMTKKCEKCGSENIDYATRIIGYLKLISKWSAERQKESQKRYYASPDKVEVMNGT